MSSRTDLNELLAAMDPELGEREYVFVTLPGVPDLASLAGVTVMAVVAESEGTTLVLPRQEADERGWSYDYVAARITLRVHSSLSAVGLTAAFTAELAKSGISCNVLSGYFHDHLFVPFDRAAQACAALAVLRDRSTPAG